MNIDDIKKINKTVVQDDGNLVSFDKQLIKLMSGVYDTNYPMIMAYNSNCLNYINSNNIENPLIINVSTVIKIKEKHDIGYEFVSECEHYLKDSVLAFNSLKHDTSNVILLNEFSEENEPIIAVCRYDKQIGCTTVNEVTSVYDRNHFENFVIRTFNAEKTFYKNKKTEQYFKSHWSRLPDDLKYALSTNYDRTSFTKCQVEQDLKNQQKKLEHIEEKNERKETIMENEKIKELREKAKSEDRNVRVSVAEYRNIPPEILAELAKDEDWYVRAVVAGNENTPPEVLAELAKDGNSKVRAWVADDKNTPQEVLKQLAKDEEWYVRKGVVGNENVPYEVLKELAKDDEGIVRRSVARNFDTPLEVLRDLAKDEDDGVRMNVAGNVNTPQEVLRELAKDGNLMVKIAVKNNLNFVKETSQKMQGGIAGMKKEAIKKVAESKVKNQSVPKKDLSR